MAETILEGVFRNIPTPIIVDILARLPPEAVIRCSCVCQPWLNLISEPEFVNLQLSKSPTCLIVHKRSTHSDSVSLVEVEDETDHHGVRRIAGTDREIPRWPSRKISFMSLIGSINGLVCIKEYSVESDIIRVWNPFMGEFITVQTRGEGEHGLHDKTTYGFGISRGKYVVVMILQIHKVNPRNNRPLFPDSTCHVYTIGDDNGVWKSIGRAPYVYTCQQHGIFVNGNLHWIIYHDGRQISCLDLENELFQPFPPVPELYEGAFAKLNLYKGCLSVCYNTSDSDIVIWAMKEYGVQNSWNKEVVISRHDLINPRQEYELVSIIKVFKDGEILLFWSANIKLFSYDPKGKILQDMDDKESMIGPSNNNAYKFHPCIEATEYVSSLVSLKSLGELNVSRC